MKVKFYSLFFLLLSFFSLGIGQSNIEACSFQEEYDEELTTEKTDLWDCVYDWFFRKREREKDRELEEERNRIEEERLRWEKWKWEKEHGETVPMKKD